MKCLKMLGLAAVAALALTAFTASSAPATTLEVGGVTQNKSVGPTWSTKFTAVLVTTGGSLVNQCMAMHLAGSTEGSFTGSKVTGAFTTFTFDSCTRPVTVHQKGQFYIEHTSGTNGTVSSENAEVTVSSPFGTLNCKTGGGTDLGLLTGTSSGQATMHVKAVLNCGFLGPSVRFEATLALTGFEGLGVSA